MREKVIRIAEALASWCTWILFVVVFPNDGFGQELYSAPGDCRDAVCWELLNPQDTAGVEISGDPEAFCRVVASIENRLIIPAEAVSPAEMAIALECPGNYREVELVSPTDEHLEQFVRHVPRSNVRRLSIMGTSGELSVSSFAKLASFPSLESVHLVATRFSRKRDVPAFSSRSLRSVVIQGHQDAFFIDWFLSAETISSLASLSILQFAREDRLSENTICRILTDGERLEELALAPRLSEPIECPTVNVSRLRAMSLEGIGGQTARALAAATFSNLQQFALHDTTLGHDGVSTLFVGSWATNLSSLGLSRVNLVSDQEYVLGRLQNLQRLVILNSAIDPDILQMLEDQGRWIRLQLLRIRGSGELVAPPRPWQIWPVLDVMDFDRVDKERAPLYQFGLCALGIQC